MDARIAAIAERQLGLITRGQLLALGMSPTALLRRVGRTLHRVHRGVYALGHPRLLPGARELGAAYATASVVSDRSASGLWQLLPSWPGDVHVTVPPDAKRRSRPGIVVHRRPLEPSEIRHIGPIPVTSPLRTINDLPKPLRERATNEALFRRLITPEQLEHPHPKTRSRPERLLLELIRRSDLPTPETNVYVAGHEVDVLFRDARVVVELDLHATHATAERFERDHRRDLDLHEAGYVVIRLTERQVRGDPDRVVHLIRRAAAPA